MSLWFYSKDEATHLDNDFAKTNYFKSIKYSAKFLETTETDETNRILRNTKLLGH